MEWNLSADARRLVREATGDAHRGREADILREAIGLWLEGERGRLAEEERSLAWCHARLRRGDFNPPLYEAVRQQDEAWLGIQDEQEWLQGRAVVAETYDYFGDYKGAQAALKTSDPRILNAISPGDNQVSLEKRRIWTTIACAHAAYRLEQYDRTLTYLNGCRARLDDLERSGSRHFGTRARLSYSFGHLARQRQQYDEALRHFTDACHFASERLRSKTGFLELTGPVSLRPAHLTPEQKAQRESERLLATWVIGKCLAFGVGWIHYTTGRLRAARLALSAGYSMLRCTEDWMHRAYAQLLLAATERAGGTAAAPMKQVLLDRIAEAEAGLATHPALSGRAAFERAIALVQLGDPKRALSVVQSAKKRFETEQKTVPKATRWICLLLVIESRSHRSLGKISDALASAAEALKKAEASDDLTSRIDALIALAEVYLPAAGNHVKRNLVAGAVTNLRTALSLLLSNPNPKMEAACWLHLARAHHRLQQKPEAAEALARWTRDYSTRVEHGFLKDLAAAVSQELAAPRNGFEVQGHDSLNIEAQTLALRKFLVEAAFTRHGDDDARAKALGLSVRQMQRLRGLLE